MIIKGLPLRFIGDGAAIPRCPEKIIGKGQSPGIVRHKDLLVARIIMGNGALLAVRISSLVVVKSRGVLLLKEAPLSEWALCNFLPTRSERMRCLRKGLESTAKRI
ncbi:MAG: hypothetical protein KJP02_01865 [Octadecabacter sp.]|nr:hypothetical protein [Octadecabacter sp.]